MSVLGRSPRPGSSHDAREAPILLTLDRVVRLSALIALASIAEIPASKAWAQADAGFDVESYSVALTPDLETKTVIGTETIRLLVTDDEIRTLWFSPNGLSITNASLDDQPIRVTSTSSGIQFEVAEAVPKGRLVTLSFQFSGLPARGVTSTVGGIYTSYFACDWMVCLQDAPGDKAGFALDLSLPPNIASLSIGQHVSAEARADGLVLHRWRSTRPYSAYLYAFAAGPFVKRARQTGSDELIYLDATGGDADLHALFRETPAMLAFLAEKAGVPLPDHRYTQLLVPGREAQEAATYSLIGIDHLTSEASQPDTAWVIVHELAHQWWGDLITSATWRDFWLNEGITTFMTAAWKEHRFGAAAYQAELDVARRRVQAVRDLNYDKPLTWAGQYPSLGARRAVQYSKGALFLDHLRTLLGDDAFWRGLREFTQTHAGGTVTSADFQAAMEAASGRDLSQEFETWVFGASEAELPSA